ncbi:MAG: hypothetical protein LBQ69_00705 [Treponema sp.]|jgi:hypothetical protein|nr:hypothetical protein [Treponema sp.]
MKKFLITVVVLLVLAGLGFFFGWAQMGIEPGAYGVIRSKSHGVDANLVRPGEFRWVWYKLIPANAQTLVFRLDTVSREVSARNTLPAAETYSAFAGVQGDFSWELRASLSFSLSPEALIPLAATYSIGTQEELDSHENDIAGQIEAFILNRINYSEEFASQIEELLENNASPGLEREIQRQFPQISNFSFVIRSAKLPDFTLYRLAKGLYGEFVARQKEFIAAELSDKALGRVETYNRFEELERYGALLSKYPVLLDFLALENGRPGD